MNEDISNGKSKGSFDLWINAIPKATGSFEPRESIEVMRENNAELGIEQDKKQVHNDMHECFLNEILDLDKKLLNTEVLDVQKEAVVELIFNAFKNNHYQQT
jgi:hypothetical protein